MTSQRGARRFAPVVAFVSALFIMPGIAVAHAELVRAIPADGETVTEPVTFVSGRYTEDLTGDSSLRILDPGGNVIATGGVDPDDVRVMVARPPTPLPDGTYTVRSTTVSVDGDTQRATWTFTVVVPASPSPTPSPVGSAPPPSATPTPASTPTASATAAPTATTAPGDTSSSISDVALPIVAALAILVIGAATLLRRGRRTGRP